ncbi:MAG TPA: hypothetical protein VG652_01285 [Gaiellaceae bacterium]|nr:hypothetical protein [Gaiellaceae bacterium]
MFASLTRSSEVAALVAGAIALLGFLFAVGRATFSWWRRPELSIVAGNTPEFRQRLVAEEIHRDSAANRGLELESVYATVLKIEELRGAFARDVLVRMVSTDPSAPPGGRGLPYPLAILRPGRPITVDIPPNGVEYVLLEEKLFFRDGSWSLIAPTNHWAANKGIKFTVEVFSGNRRMATHSFLIIRHDEHNSWPDVVAA